MKKNMGSADRIVRLLIAAIVALLYFTSENSDDSAPPLPVETAPPKLGKFVMQY